MANGTNQPDSNHIPPNNRVRPEVLAKTLVESLTDVAAGLRGMAERLEPDEADRARHFADVLDQCAATAAVLNMQREEIESRVGKVKIKSVRG